MNKPHNKVPKKINIKINKKNMLLTLVFTTIILLVLSSVMLVYSYKIPVNRNVVKTIKYADLNVVSDTKFIVKPALIYDYKTIIGGTKTYYSLVKEVIVRIMLNSKVYHITNAGNPSEVKASFTESTYIKTSEWSKEVVINSSVLNNKANQYTIEFRINMLNVSEIVNKINSEINKITNEYKIIITPNIIVSVKYENGLVKKYTISPTIQITIDRNANVVTISIDDTQKTIMTKNTIALKNYLNPIRISVNDARFYSFIFTSILAPLALGSTFYYLHKYGLNRKEKNLLEKYGKYIIKGEIKALGDKPVIRIEDSKLLIKLAKIYKKPIIYDEKNNSFFIVMSDTAYMFKPRD